MLGSRRTVCRILVFFQPGGALWLTSQSVFVCRTTSGW